MSGLRRDAPFREQGDSVPGACRTPFRSRVKTVRLGVGTLSVMPPECCPPSFRNRVRHGPVRAVINQIRAFLLEYGLPVAVGRSRLLKQLPTVLEDAENGVSHAMRRLLSQLQRAWDDEIDEVTAQIEGAAASDDRCSSLQTIPGIGP